MLITTSRKPSNRTRTFCKDLRAVVPGSLLMNRGKRDFQSLMDSARENGYSRVLVVQESHGNPARIDSVSVAEENWEWGPVLEFTSVRLSREVSGVKFKQFQDLSLAAESKADEERALQVFGELFMEGSELVMRVEKGFKRVTFYYDGREIGPSFRVTSFKAKGEGE